MKRGVGQTKMEEDMSEASSNSCFKELDGDIVIKQLTWYEIFGVTPEDSEGHWSANGGEEMCDCFHDPEKNPDSKMIAINITEPDGKYIEGSGDGDYTWEVSSDVESMAGVAQLAATFSPDEVHWYRSGKRIFVNFWWD